MTMGSSLLEKIGLSPQSEEMIEDILQGNIPPLPAESLSFVVSLLAQRRRGVIFIPVSDYRALDYAGELSAFLGSSEVFEFPDFESLPHERLTIVTSGQHKRVEFLSALGDSRFTVGVIHPTALIRKFPPLECYQPASLTIKRGEEIEFDWLIDILVRFGYRREEITDYPGSFSVRGGIIDVYPSGLSMPVRIEFFGDEVESLRSFDVESQLSVEEVDRVVIGWETDTPVTDDELGQLDVEETEGFLSGRKSLSGYWPILFERLSVLPDILESFDYLLVFEDFKKVSRELSIFFSEVRSAIESGAAPSNRVDDYFVRPEQALEKLLKLDFIDLSESTGVSVPVFESVSREMMREPGMMDRLLHETKKIYVFCGADQKPDRVKHSVDRLLEGRDISAEVSDGYLRGGFLFKPEKTMFLPASFITGSQVVIPYKRKVRFERNIELQLEEGDLVVHRKYGIGRFSGVVKEARDEVMRELIVIEYADGRLKIPLDQADRITRYTGDESNVQLDKLGSNEWKKARERARKSAKRLAFNLLRVYAKRTLVRRTPYDVSNPWVYEFESMFPYEETLDQAAAINDVYSDMSDEYPMERLVVGDVGFGKTEVAMRAAFLAVVSGRQVLVLAPTTVLVEQHYQTWSDRFRHFPVKIAMISRFVKPAERRKTIEEYNRGKVDILIGTHALLREDILLENTGLAVIDEEHRFGVNQKEKFKAKKPEIDILYLSATPIPRTLQLALSGVRKISLIETPPPGRLPVVTFIGEFDERLVETAVKRELEREGQVLFVHNRIDELPDYAALVQSLVPDASVAVAHGQMNGRKLEKIILDYWSGKIDVLVTTTIIESGLDMPNVNTLVVSDAERLGLAQAYQLRGRIGRSYRQAYAYFLTKKEFLTEREEKRLKALAELSGLGAGFRLALRDLEIRGAGNLLGPEQHGHIVRVGLGFFLEMLREEVEALRGTAAESLSEEVSIDLPVNVFIPDSYIDAWHIKHEVYRRASFIKNREEFERLKRELVDRFGEPPEQVQNLLKLGWIRNLAIKAGVSTLKWENGYVEMRGKAFREESVRLLPAFKSAKWGLNSLKIKVEKSALLDFMIELFADIISALNK